MLDGARRNRARARASSSQSVSLETVGQVPCDTCVNYAGSAYVPCDTCVTAGSACERPLGNGETVSEASYVTTPGQLPCDICVIAESASMLASVFVTSLVPSDICVIAESLFTQPCGRTNSGSVRHLRHFAESRIAFAAHGSQKAQTVEAQSRESPNDVLTEGSSDICVTAESLRTSASIAGS